MSQAPYTAYTRRILETAPTRTQSQELKTEEMVLNMGPQHPSTHGVLRLELVTDGEVVVDVVPHLGYMHRCFEKHAENLSYEQSIPFVDRLDYLGAILDEHAWAMGVEQLCGIKELPPRVEYSRVLMAELNRIASHLLAIGTFGIDVGAVTSFLWALRDREHILNLLEWASGARLLYNYIWIGGLYYDLPPDFETRCREFATYFAPRIDELDTLLTENSVFIARTANVGVLPLDVALNFGVTGPSLRASGLAYDLRREDGYSVYPELTFDIPVGSGQKGTIGDCWDRFWVRVQEMRESLRIIHQCLDALEGNTAGGAAARTLSYSPREKVPRKARPVHDELYFRAETARGITGFYYVAEPKRDIPFRCKCRAPSFSNLSVLPEISRGVLISDLVAIIGSLDIVLCEIDR